MTEAQRRDCLTAIQTAVDAAFWDAHTLSGREYMAFRSLLGLVRNGTLPDDNNEWETLDREQAAECFPDRRNQPTHRDNHI